ncbi:MAG: ATP synthase F1 subunit delta [Bacteroidia bacterium]|nr:ATP synthase F1 subunit delta [Bacteroidia bacterium]MDW8345837.1 ATP synthase F1 subunit delta [Bacteroidia bacterium]
MSLARVAQRYVKPLIEVALEQKIEKRVLEDLAFVDHTIKTNRNLAVMLSNPIIYSDKKQKVLQEIFRGKVHELVIKFFEVLAKNTRDEILPYVYTAYKNEYNRIKDIHEVKVISASELNAQNMQEIEALCQKIYKTGTISIQHAINPDLIAGIIIQTEYKQFDLSVSSRLRKVKSELI